MTSMDGHTADFRVGFSVGTKLIISLLLLLSAAIAYLDISSILLFRDDKKAYTYQAQSIEAESAGRDFINISRQAFGTLHLLLASIDPEKPITKQQEANLQSIMNNQAGITTANLGLLDRNTGEYQVAFQSSKAGSQPIYVDDLKIPTSMIKESLTSLSKDGYAFFNLSKLGQDPLMAFVRADTKFKGSILKLPVSIGYVLLKDFGKEIKTSVLTIATRSGSVLFSTDQAAIFGETRIAEDPVFQAGFGSSLATGVQEYMHLGTKFLGSFVKPGFDLLVLTKTAWFQAMAPTYLLIEQFILLGLMTIGATIIFAVLFAKTVTKPIYSLYEATKEVASGNFDVKLPEKGHDELSALTRAFLFMSKKISELIVESMQKVQLENELTIASTVQHTFLPPAKHEDSNIQIHSYYQTASQCGGDWWGFFSVGRKMCIMISDATGHGLPSALLTASARSCLSVIQKQARENSNFNLSPSVVLSYLNHVIFDAAKGHIMMTFFVGVIDFDTKVITYANAGHNPPWLMRKDVTGYSIESLLCGGLRLGESGEAVLANETKVPFQTGDILFLYTDGIIENRDGAGDPYGKKQARKLVLENAPAGPEAMIKNLVADYQAFNKDRAPDDDITLVAAKLVAN